MTIRSGSCNCGQVRYQVEGEPKRVGLCHCTDCRQESGAAFTYYAIWPTSAFKTTGETAVHQGRRFCPACCSRVFAYDEDEAEIKLGTLQDAPTGLKPTYELWIKRREPWLQPVEGAAQFEEDRI
ncbi:GFA family protein [Rhizobium sp. 768_B6_N1_8]|uniref:GFA family protein n=1 Tax=unclassified Rhizobium TaxID=2613769 RepID=UPI003F27BA10